jgi:DHA1 family tetracycline resistance protein-like MFS transporter
MTNQRRMAILFSIVFTNMMAGAAVVPLLPLYAVEELGATPLMAGFVLSSFFAAQLFGGPLVGRLADRFGRRPLLLVSQSGSVASYVVLVYALPLGKVMGDLPIAWGVAPTLVPLFLARIVGGLTGGSFSVAEAYASDISSGAERARALGLVGAGVALGFLAGPVFGGLLAGVSVRAAFVGAVLAMSLPLVLTALFLPEPAVRNEDADTDGVSIHKLLLKRRVQLILAIHFLFMTGFSVVQSTFTLFASQVLFPNSPLPSAARNAALLLGWPALLVGLGQLFLVGPVTKRIGEVSSALSGYLIGATGVLAIAVAAPSVASVLLGFTPFAIGWSISQPNLQSLLTREGDTSSHGRLLGLFQSMGSLALMIGPLIGGYTFQTFVPQSVFFAAGGLLVAAGLLTAWRRRTSA